MKIRFEYLQEQAELIRKGIEDADAGERIAVMGRFARDNEDAVNEVRQRRADGN